MRKQMLHVLSQALLVAAALLFLLVQPSPLAAQEASATPTPVDADEPPTEPPVAELFAERGRLKEFLRELGSAEEASAVAARRKQLQDLSAELAHIREAVETDSIGKMRFETLIDLQTEIRAEARNLQALADDLQGIATGRDRDLDRLDDNLAHWTDLANIARERDAPASVLGVAADMQQELQDARASLKADRDAALEDLAAISDLQHTATAFGAELRERQNDLESVSERASDLPLWQGASWESARGLVSLVEAGRRYSQGIAAHLREFGTGLALAFLTLLVAIYWLLRRTGVRVVDAMQRDSTSMRAASVFQRPHSAALLLALLGIVWLGPPAPTSFSYLLWAVVPFPAAALAVTVYAKPIRLSVYTIAVVIAMMALRPLLDATPLLARLMLVLQSSIMLVAVIIDYRRGNYGAAFPGVRDNVITWTVRVVVAALLATIAAEILGLVGLAKTWRTVVLGGLGFAMIFASITYVLTGLVLSLLYIRPFSGLAVVRNQRWTIIRTLRKGIRTAVGLLWVLVVLGFAGILEPLTAAVQGFLDTEVKLGAITFDLSQIAVGLLILFLTWLVNRLVKFMLAAKSLSGTNIAASVTYAASKILGYGIAVAGFLFAIAAMGFDITRVTVLAGALGVGIGFGLQNIVNNFLSGLIMLFEQPIKIDDITSVDNLMGKVKEMNIRATVIETFDGAEVIVPNADFISKTVTNWTKSNRRRRAEIDVGVAYGTEAQAVIDLLETIARRHEEVVTDPEPFAIFTGFGDSSLNFRLYVWLSELSMILTTPSKIRQEIQQGLADAGIEVPFPQRDVRVTLAGGELPESLVQRAGAPAPGQA